MTMPQLSLTPVGAYWLVGLVACALLGLVAIGPGSRANKRRRATLAGLRLTTVLLVLAAMLRPTIVYTTTKQQQATLILLADVSRSMQVADAFGNKTRYEALKAAFDEASPILAELSQDLEVKIYSFDAEAHELETKDGKIELPAKPEGKETAIGWVLEDLLRREAGKRLAGIILLSDGAVRAVPPRDLSPQYPAGRLRDLGHKLYTVAFGQTRGPGQSRDLALRDLVTNQTVFEKNQLVATGNLRVAGLVDQPLRVQMLFETAPGKMEVVATRPARATQDGQQIPIELAYVPQNGGEYKLTLRADPQPGELVTTNNEMSTFVTVLKGGLNVLYLEGRLLPEQKFLRQALDASPDIKVDLVRINPDKPQPRPREFLERFKPGKYDVYLLGDLDSSIFSPEELAALRSAVDAGAGLMMLGGIHSFGPGGYSATPLAEVLPIEMDKLERQRAGEPTRSDVHIPPPVKMRPVGRSYITQLAAQNNAAVWDKLPPLDGANKFRKVKPAAHVLIEGEPGQPLLVAQESGGGRVLAFAGDTTWRWPMQGHADVHKRFWRQVVLWLAKKDQQTDGNVWISLDQRRFAPGARVEFTAGARTAQGDAVTDAEFQCELILPDKTRKNVSLSSLAEAMSGSLVETQQAGDYTLAVTATQAGNLLGSAQARFLVFEQDLELDNSAAEPGSLDTLAKTTGGKSLPPEHLADLLEELKDVPKQLEIEVQTKRTLWDKWPLFVVVAGLLAVEWFLRKKWGLV